MRCPHCMHMVEEDTRTCPHCGGRVRGQQAALVIALALLWCCSLGVPLISRAFMTDEGSLGWFAAALGVFVAGIAGMVLLAQNSARALPLSRISRTVAIGMLFLLLYVLATPGYAWRPLGGDARISACTNNQRQITVAVQMYAQDHDGLLPTSWTDLRDNVAGTTALRCPATRDEHTPALSYGLNRHLLGKSLETFAQHAPTLLLVADGNRGLLTGPQDIAVRHTKHRYVAACLDGHVESRMPTDDAGIRWK